MILTHQHHSFHSTCCATATTENRLPASENRRRNSGEPQRKWADPGDLPPDTVDYTAAIIKAAERGDNFVLNGW